MKKIGIHEVGDWLESLRRSYHSSYYAMYSSLCGGVVTDPVMMMLPVDDHVAHRGDGVFETLKCVDGGIYNLDAHLARLWSATESISISAPVSQKEMRDIVVETVRAGGEQNCSIRILVSRGPGSLGVNPYDSPTAAVYVIVSALATPFSVIHPEGAALGISSIPSKRPCFAAVKSCNYIQNVLMKKEAVDMGVDFVAGFDDGGLLTEAATANIGIVSPSRELLFPRLVSILSGTTMLRTATLAESLIADGVLAGIANADITVADMRKAREILVVGTTINVVPVRAFDGKPVGDGVPGPVFEALSARLVHDVAANDGLRTQVFL